MVVDPAPVADPVIAAAGGAEPGRPAQSRDAAARTSGAAVAATITALEAKVARIIGPEPPSASTAAKRTALYPDGPRGLLARNNDTGEMYVPSHGDTQLKHWLAKMNIVSTEASVYADLVWMAGDELDYATVSIKLMAKHLGCSHTTCDKYLDRLVHRGVIRVLPPLPKSSCNRYTFAKFEDWVALPLFPKRFPTARFPASTRWKSLVPDSQDATLKGAGGVPHGWNPPSTHVASPPSTHVEQTLTTQLRKGTLEEGSPRQQSGGGSSQGHDRLAPAGPTPGSCQVIADANTAAQPGGAPPVTTGTSPAATFVPPLGTVAAPASGATDPGAAAASGHQAAPACPKAVESPRANKSKSKVVFQGRGKLPPWTTDPDYDPRCTEAILAQIPVGTAAHDIVVEAYKEATKDGHRFDMADLNAAWGGTGFVVGPVEANPEHFPVTLENLKEFRERSAMGLMYIAAAARVKLARKGPVVFIHTAIGKKGDEARNVVLHHYQFDPHPDRNVLAEISWGDSVCRTAFTVETRLSFCRARGRDLARRSVKERA